MKGPPAGTEALSTSNLVMVSINIYLAFVFFVFFIVLSLAASEYRTKTPSPRLEKPAYSAQHPGRADYTSGFLHSAIIEGLQPSTTYYYSCGDETLAMSSVRSFTTPAKVGAEQAITLGILGDLGQTDDSA